MTSLASTTDTVPTSRGPVAYLREVWARREFAWYLATSDLKARNASTSLGVLWWILNPLLLTGVYFLVFGLILKIGRRSNPEYLAYLMAGMFAFQFTAGVVNGAAKTILSNAKLIVNLRFPRLLLPISSIMGSGIGFLISIVAFFMINVPLARVWPGWALLWLGPILVVHVVFNLGLAALAARLAVPFRDVSNLLPYLIRIWLYLSPILWPLEALDDMPGWVTTAMNFNPMFHLLSLYRAALIGAEFDPANLLGAAIFALIIGLLGTVLFARFERKLVQFL